MECMRNISIFHAVVVIVVAAAAVYCCWPGYVLGAKRRGDDRLAGAQSVRLQFVVIFMT